MSRNSVLIGWPNRAAGATLSSGSWTGLSNLNNSNYWEVARSANAGPDNTVIDIDIGSVKALRAIALAAHNLSASASWRIKLGTTAGASDIYDSGNQAVWAMAFDTESFVWEDQFWWEGYTAGDDYQGSPHLACWPLPNWYSARYARIEISDSSNPAGFVQIGRLFIGGGFQPELGCGYGKLSERWLDGSEVVASAAGDDLFVQRRRLREARFGLDHLTAGAEFQAVFEMQRRQGISGEVLFLPEPDSVAECQRRGFIGRMTELSPIEYPYYRHRGAGFVIKETS